MNFTKVIKEEFDAFVKKTFPKEDVQKFLINHERKDLLIKNLSHQIKEAETIFFSLGETQEDKRRTVKNLMLDFCKMFCMAALESKEKQMKQKHQDIRDEVARIAAKEKRND